MIPVSVVIITLNEEKNLERCLRSVKRIADEIVVIDSMSTDRTVVIAESHGARLYQQKFTGFVEQKRIATTIATHDWVFSIDADEALSPELEQSILAFKNSSPPANAYRISRITNYCGKWIKHCGWYPDRIVRLFNKTKGQWQGGTVHEKWEPADKNPGPLLSGELLHYSYSSLSEHVKKTDKYTELGARDAVKNGKDCSMLKILLVPGWNFFASYIIRLGILDGYYGFIICKMDAYGSFIKYAKTREYARLQREGKQF
jgi:glycosyltransferase involved in cell wall biosynthesis